MQQLSPTADSSIKEVRSIAYRPGGSPLREARLRTLYSLCDCPRHHRYTYLHMTLHRASSSSVQPHTPLSPNHPVRRLSGFSVSEQSDNGAGDGGAAADPLPTVAEEINEIKRYEDFSTIDWVQDAVQEQARRRARRRQGHGFWDREGTFAWRRKLWESYDAGQAWLVVTLVGAAIGLNAAFLNIVTEWLSDIKLGYCTSAFYLNEQFCCWGAEDGRREKLQDRRHILFVANNLTCFNRMSGMAPLGLQCLAKLYSIFPFRGTLLSSRSWTES